MDIKQQCVLKHTIDQNVVPALPPLTMLCQKKFAYPQLFVQT